MLLHYKNNECFLQYFFDVQRAIILGPLAGSKTHFYCMEHFVELISWSILNHLRKSVLNNHKQWVIPENLGCKFFGVNLLKTFITSKFVLGIWPFSYFMKIVKTFHDSKWSWYIVYVPRFQFECEFLHIFQDDSYFRVPTELWQQNMGNMGFSKTKLWL